MEQPFNMVTTFLGLSSVRLLLKLLQSHILLMLTNYSKSSHYNLP